MTYGTWLSAARAEEKRLGVDHHEMACYASRLTPYVQNHLAVALRDLEQLYAELPSPIAEDVEQREYWEGTRREYVSRIRAALDHIGAALTAVGCTDEELRLAGRIAVTEKEGEEPAETEADDDQDTHVNLRLESIRVAVAAAAARPSWVETEK